jgi:hypothetical protein
LGVAARLIVAIRKWRHEGDDVRPCFTGRTTSGGDFQDHPDTAGSWLDIHAINPNGRGTEKAGRSGGLLPRHGDVDGGGELRAHAAHTFACGAQALLALPLDDNHITAPRFGEVPGDARAHDMPPPIMTASAVSDMRLLFCHSGTAGAKISEPFGALIRLINEAF